MKKSAKFIAGALLASFMVSGAFASGKKDEEKTVKFGTLSYLNYSENDFSTAKSEGREVAKVLASEGYIKDNMPGAPEGGIKGKVVYFDTLDSMIMALTSGKIDRIGSIPQTTARYLVSQNPSIMPMSEFDYEKAMKDGGFAVAALNVLGDGFSFMMRENQTALRDDFNKAIAEMQKDGTAKKLIAEYILKLDSLKPIELEQKEGRETITVAVTGSLPPFDYVAPDGTFAGFNTAYLAEIGKRLDKNIKLVQVSSVGRATALSSGTVDVVFWTRSCVDPSTAKMSGEDFIASVEKKGVFLAEKERHALRDYLVAVPPTKYSKRDMPAGTIITNPYFTDMPVGVFLKK